MIAQFLNGTQKRLCNWHNEGITIMDNIMAYIRASELLASEDAYRIAGWLSKVEVVKKQISGQFELIDELIEEINAT